MSDGQEEQRLRKEHRCPGNKSPKHVSGGASPGASDAGADERSDLEQLTARALEVVPCESESDLEDRRRDGHRLEEDDGDGRARDACEDAGTEPLDEREGEGGAASPVLTTQAHAPQERQGRSGEGERRIGALQVAEDPLERPVAPGRVAGSSGEEERLQRGRLRARE